MDFVPKRILPKRFILGISGASGVKLAKGFLRHIAQDFEAHIIISKGALECAKYELKCDESELKAYLLESCQTTSSQVKSTQKSSQTKANKAKSSNADSSQMRHSKIKSSEFMDFDSSQSFASQNLASKDCKAYIYEDSEIGAPVASGSFEAQAMAIIPTSMDCLAKIACGISDTLLTRAASVMIKERRTLLLAPREMPLNAIVCEQMQKLAALGVIIAPPIIAYYSYPKDLEEMENFIYGKWLDILGIPNELFTRWGER
ncbi:UbiX family flavin prenyltransferase [Helicobacter sp. MIT 01-3238]|uniref:UbiX family flavin prenyltransferase n=1 Tax=Helicobacter sp. MIT 01-3238 TaxID=398627 RepID=UPI000E38C995|nr:UbiX family flavin prenyltransferase [Helicobacter sp. MIT 01-3238]RDU52305.1 3-octaprenyl-4-hydroxybenzoate carboxy-lyase [Helicobacter sp. MIT 01-3238]